MKQSLFKLFPLFLLLLHFLYIFNKSFKSCNFFHSHLLIHYSSLLLIINNLGLERAFFQLLILYVLLVDILLLPFFLLYIVQTFSPFGTWHQSTHLVNFRSMRWTLWSLNMAGVILSASSSHLLWDLIDLRIEAALWV